MGPGELRCQASLNLPSNLKPSLGSTQLYEQQQPAIPDGLCSSSTASRTRRHFSQGFGAEEALATVQGTPQSQLS